MLFVLHYLIAIKEAVMGSLISLLHLNWRLIPSSGPIRWAIDRWWWPVKINSGFLHRQLESIMMTGSRQRYINCSLPWNIKQGRIWGVNQECIRVDSPLPSFDSPMKPVTPQLLHRGASDQWIVESPSNSVLSYWLDLICGRFYSESYQFHWIIHFDWFIPGLESNVEYEIVIGSTRWVINFNIFYKY